MLDRMLAQDSLLAIELHHRFCALLEDIEPSLDDLGVVVCTNDERLVAVVAEVLLLGENGGQCDGTLVNGVEDVRTVALRTHAMI